MSATTPRALLLAYDAVFRARLVVGPDDAEDPAALAAAVDALPRPARALLELLRLVVPVGEPIPERLRALIDRDGAPLWEAALLLPRPGLVSAEIHPQRYAAACRLNPTLAAVRLEVDAAMDGPFVPSLPPSDARADAVILAAHLESTPCLLNQDGSLRRDHERRLAALFGGDADRASLALRVGRQLGLIRGSRDRLLGMPEANPRALHDPRPLFERAELRAVDVILRVLGSTPIRASEWVSQLGREAPEVLHTPPDPLGWERGEGAVFRRALDALHRIGAIDAMRDAAGVTAFRAATGVGVPTAGFLLMPDLDVLVHAGELPMATYGRLCRLAPYVEGAMLHRHRITREGAGAEVAAGHTDTLAFLASHSRTGLPPSVADTVREWQRAASRISILVGVDVIEGPDGLKLRTGPPPPDARVFDYAHPHRARFCVEGKRITIPEGWDALTVRATVARVARFVAHERGMWIYAPEIRVHANPDAIVNRLNEAYGGLIPGELEVMIRAGAGLPPVEAVPAWVLNVPESLLAGLRRDPALAATFRRVGPGGELVVREAELQAVEARLTELGVELKRG